MALGGEQIAGRGEVKVEPGRPIRGLLPWFRSEMLVVTVDRVSERHSVDKENLQVLELSNGMVWVLQTRFLCWEESGFLQVRCSGKAVLSLVTAGPAVREAALEIVLCRACMFCVDPLPLQVQIYVMADVYSCT